MACVARLDRTNALDLCEFTCDCLFLAIDVFSNLYSRSAIRLTSNRSGP